MPKLILTFKDQASLDVWYGMYSDGGGQDVIYDGIADSLEGDEFTNFEMPDIEETK